MKAQNIAIQGIPAILWGPASGRLMLAAHGDQSNKADTVIAILAEEAAEKGYQTLSFDLPEHGDRKAESRLCKAQNCVEDLSEVMKFAHTLSEDICLFGCSTGAYFSMLAFPDEPIRQALFLSPVIDMKRIIDNMMKWFGISEEQLWQQQEIPTPMKTLYWDYYQYVVKHPVQWYKPTALLYGKNDTLCEYQYVRCFAERTRADITIFDEGEHFFHTDAQLAFFRQWLQNSIAV